MENKKQQTNEDTERRQHNTSDKPGNGNGRTAEGRDRIYAPCNNSEEGLRRPLYSGRRNPLPSCCANTHTHTEHTCSPTCPLVTWQPPVVAHCLSLRNVLSQPTKCHIHKHIEKLVHRMDARALLTCGRGVLHSQA